MTVPANPATRPRCGRWLIVALTLIGLLGQLSLQGLALPGDTPRATILRLTGIDISPEHGADAAGPAEHHRHMMMPAHGMSHHHMSGMAVSDGHGQTHHQHDAGCVLCPLLIICGVILTAAPFLPGVSSAFLSMRRIFAQPRGPPAFVRVLPPLRGPPCLI
ncbi:DUF2946 domain-containing protein [Acetobacter musti]|uniref:DUF2946 domain-containing protein n=1 Tax=Acetobacter musti TaxID=864732 RepID=A0ABX0JPF4_9PROT|nr:DUF2946 family protein [Acetobacter musti]NHN84381.1 DUF2946 domain-containing protein [Acetobacter musti]